MLALFWYIEYSINPLNELLKDFICVGSEYFVHYFRDELYQSDGYEGDTAYPDILHHAPFLGHTDRY